MRGGKRIDAPGQCMFIYRVLFIHASVRKRAALYMCGNVQDRWRSKGHSTPTHLQIHPHGDRETRGVDTLNQPLQGFFLQIYPGGILLFNLGLIDPQ